MLNPYYIGSHISAKKFRKLAELFINGEKVAFTAKHLGMEQKTVRDIFRRIRKRLEEDCRQRVRSLYAGLLDYSFPCNFVHPAIRYKNFQMREDASRYVAAVVALSFTDGTVATGILKMERLSLNSKDFPVEKPEYVEEYWLMQYGLSNCSFADLQFVSRGSLNEVDAKKDYMQTFWRYARLLTSQSDRRDSGKFYFHLKEIEWRFNNLTDQEKEDMIDHLETTALQKKKMNRESGANKLENPKITSINTKLHPILLELLEKNPLEQISLMNENTLHI